MTTPAQEVVLATLDKLLHEQGSPFRCGALLLSYPTNPPKEGDCQIAQAVGLKEANIDCAGDALLLIRALRALADDLERKFKKAAKR